MNTKTGRSYVTDDGVAVPEHTLYQAECSCGYKTCWYAKPENAAKSLRSHGCNTSAEARTRALDPFPLIEETSDPSELPTVSDWLRAGSPMREVS